MTNMKCFSLKWYEISTIVVFSISLIGCGGGDLPLIFAPDVVSQQQYYDYTPPNLVLSMRDRFGETTQPQASSAEVLLASDEPLAVNANGGPLAFFELFTFGYFNESYEVSFADSTRTLIRIRLSLKDASNYQMKFSVPDNVGNQTNGEIIFSTKAVALPVGGTASNLSTEIVTPTFALQNGVWIPSGNDMRTASFGAQPGYNPTPYPVNSTVGANGLPVHIPPLILERVRGPNYTWSTQYKYQIPCPVGYYCPPVETVAPQAPLNPTPNLTGIGGELIKLCWVYDCGTQIAENLLNRGIRGFFTSPIKR